jgi:hypothetical protein
MQDANDRGATRRWFMDANLQSHASELSGKVIGDFALARRRWIKPGVNGVDPYEVLEHPLHIACVDVWHANGSCRHCHTIGIEHSVS